MSSNVSSTTPPSGSAHPHGAWIWRLANLRTDYLPALSSCGVKRAYLKVFDANSKPMFWAFQCTTAAIQALEAVGVEVWGWGFHYGKPSAGAEVKAIAKAMACGLKGYVVDVEDAVEDPSTHGNVQALLTALRAIVPSGNLGYTSFGRPALHKRVPWQILDALCELAFPQVYFETWLGAGANDTAKVASRIQKSIKEHIDLGLKLPILPIFSSETGDVTSATLQQALVQHPGSSLWRLPDLGQPGVGWSVSYT
jgi:hypothetical protein